MRSAFKSIYIVVLAATVLAATGCGSSGTISSSAAAPSAASSAPSSSAASTSASATATTASTPSVPPTTSSSADTGATLTTDQIRGLLLTDKDDPGYVYDAAKDYTSTSDTPDAVTGGSACQMFADATNALSTKYGTTVEAGRRLTKSADGHEIRSEVAVMPSVENAKALISDLTTGLKGCKSLSVTQGSESYSMELGVVPQLVKDDQVGYINYTSASGKTTVLLAVELVRVGTAVSVVGLVGPSTTDSVVLGKMGLTLARLSDVQAERVKVAEGLS